MNIKLVSRQSVGVDTHGLWIVQDGTAHRMVMGDEEGVGQYGIDWIFVVAENEASALAVAAAYDAHRTMDLRDDPDRDLVAAVSE